MNIPVVVTFHLTSPATITCSQGEVTQRTITVFLVKRELATTPYKGNNSNVFLSCLILFSSFSYITADSFIAGGNRSTQRKPPTSRKSLTNFIT